MPNKKISYEEQKAKLSEKIKNSESIISTHREKIKSWQNEIKTIETDEKKIFAEEFLNIIIENGLTEKNDKKDFLAEISKIAKQTAAAKKEKSSLQESENKNLKETE